MSNGIVTDPRMLQGGGFRTPLRRFRGTFKGYTPSPREGAKGPYTLVELDWTDVEVIESVEPYPFPTAKLEVLYQNNRNTMWHVLLESFRSVGRATLDAAVGGRFEMLGTLDRYMGYERGGEPQKRDCWEAVEALDGAEPTSGVDVEATALKLLDGRTREEFDAIALVSAAIKSDNAIYSAIVQGTWTSWAVATGRATLGEDGVYSVT